MKKIFLFILVTLVCTACEHNISPEVQQVSGAENGHDYVDLGLSVMWAPVNLGATIVGEYGDYYAWGETESKNYFSSDNYKYCTKKGSMYFYTKYCYSSTEGIVDSLTILLPEDDATHVQWGGSWRIPTKEEWIELREKCIWKYSRKNDKKGWTATGPNGKSIFFPLPGGITWNENNTHNHTGYYRSASLGEKYSGTTFIIIMRSDTDDTEELTWSNGSREFGQSIRPICSPSQKD